MKAVTWRGKPEVSVEDVPDPRIDNPTDAIRVTSTQNKHDGAIKIVLRP